MTHLSYPPPGLLDAVSLSCLPIRSSSRCFKGRMRKLLMTAERNGYFFVLDRVTGEHLVPARWSTPRSPTSSHRVSRRKRVCSISPRRTHTNQLSGRSPSARVDGARGPVRGRRSYLRHVH